MTFRGLIFRLIGVMIMLTPQLEASTIKTESLNYKIGSESFEGLFTTPQKSSKAKLPSVLLVHNWMGVTDETKYQAERIAELGYNVLSADIYGKGIRPKNLQDAGQLAGTYKSNRNLLREHLLGGLKKLRSMDGVDGGKILAVGYCFGGTSVLELARAGADIRGVVSFHGGLDSPRPADGSKIKAKVLILHGADDPFQKVEDLTAFEKEMRTNKIDWQMVSFGRAVHSFTDKGAGTDNSKGAAYNAAADSRSFEIFKLFTTELFK